MSEALSISTVKTLCALPADPSGVEDGLYTIEALDNHTVSASDDQIKSEVWFKSPPLTLDTIERLHSLQLFAESRDQGFADEPSAGNWTWFELAIFENSSATSPKVKDTVKLVWTSHKNRFMSNEFDWAEGSVFGREHELFGLLEPGNAIGVLLCARFPGWDILVTKGFLVVEIGERLSNRPAIDFKPIVESLNTIQEIMDEANAKISVSFIPAHSDTVRRADGFSAANERPLRVLSLDGGGIRGLSSLYILREVMNKAAPNKKPYEVFDMIAGTSTGGLIAIMLGRLKLSVDECIAEYENFARKVFASDFLGKKIHFAKNKEFYDSSVLEEVIKGVISKSKNGDRDAKLLDNDDSDCKVFVVAVREDAVNNREPVILRSYTNPQRISLLPDVLLWEACRATSAAPVYFHPIKVGQYQLVDGGLGANNPLGWVWNEMLDVFGAARTTDCFLSIGTGIPQNKALGKAGILFNNELAEGFASAATNSQLTHVLFKTLINAYAPRPTNKKYWRLNIGEETKENNYKDVGELDDVGKIDMIRAMTKEYIAVQDDLIDGVVSSLKASLQ